MTRPLRGPRDTRLELLERDHELAVLRAAVERAAGGSGGAVAVVGAAGVGKTRLLEAAAALGRERRFAVLTAEGTPLEQEFAFGVARQLLEPAPGSLDRAARERAMSGAGALAAPVLEATAPGGTSRQSGDAIIAASHGLYWTVANLAESQPLVLAVDDLHWADTASLRWLAYLARRLDGLRVLLICAVRRGDRAAEREPLRQLLARATTELIAVRPLTPPGTAQLVSARFGSSADDEFLRACHEASGGNPLLLRLLLDALEGDDRAPSAQRLRELGRGALAPYIAARLAGLPPPCRELAHAAAVLGARALPSDAAAVAGVDLLPAAGAADILVQAGLLSPGPELTYVHPLLRDAVEADLGEHRRAALHRRAAEVLRRGGAPAERVAAHLLATPPARDSQAAGVLATAAREASERGDTESAVRLLRRALDEAERFPGRPRAVLELGVLEATLMDPVAEVHLRDALAACRAPSDRAVAAKALGTALMMARKGDEAITVFERAYAELEPVDREAALTMLAGLANLGQYVISTQRRILAHVKRLRTMDLRGDTRAERTALGPLAIQAALDGEPVAVIADLARRALQAPVDDLPAEDTHVQCALLALQAAGEHQEVSDRLGPILADAQRRASHWGVQTAWGILAMTSLDMGLVLDAEAHARAALALGRQHGHANREPILMAILVPALLDQGRLVEADAELAAAPLPANWEEGWPALPLHVAVARLRRAQGRMAEAVAELRACARLAERWSVSGLFNIPWRSELALADPADRDSRRLAAEEVQLARAAGAPGPIGIALRAQALLTGGEQAIALLGEAIEALERSQARLEHARTLVELGAALRRANRRSEARPPLRLGIEIAHRCGASGVVTRGQIELRATGARPRRLVYSGLEALTASERRVAELAGDGLTNRDIAQALFVTTKTVETHLRHIYAKLGITSRAELPEALEREVAAAA